MNTLSVFPSLLTYGLLAPFLLRLIVAAFLIYLGRRRFFKSYKWSSILYIASAVLIILGWYTQPVALLAIAVLKFDIYVDYWKNRNFVPVRKETYFLYYFAIIILISLLFTGPGFLAFDLPL